MKALEFSILGPVGMKLDGRPVSLPPGRPLALLTALLIGRGQLSVDRLATALWDSPPVSALPNLRTYAAQLRRVLDRHRDRLVRAGDGYALTVQPGELDLQEWESALADARQAAKLSRPAEAADLLTAALALWTGVAAEGVPRRGPVGRSLDTLDQARFNAMERYAQACLDIGRFDQAVDCLRPLLADQPTREVAWHHLVLALARAGDRGSALEAYSAARHALVTELGIEPGAELRELQHLLLRDTADDPRAAKGTQAAPIEAVAATLPPDTELVGRDGLLAGIVDQLSEPGVVALHGPAGVGKSVLALRAAWELTPRYPGGQLYLDMCGSSPGLTPMALGEALGSLLRALGARTVAGSVAEDLASLSTSLAKRRAVVVLDNVVDAASPARRSCSPAVPCCPLWTFAGRWRWVSWIRIRHPHSSLGTARTSGSPPRPGTHGFSPRFADTSRWRCGSSARAWPVAPTGRSRPWWSASPMNSTALTSWPSTTSRYAPA
jgi:DNA-binding SARP family transcriptional activator